MRNGIIIIGRVLASMAASLFGCIVIFDLFFAIRSISSTGMLMSVSQLWYGALFTLWTFPGSSAWDAAHFLWLFKKLSSMETASEAVLAYVQRYVEILLKDAFLVAVLALIIYMFERKRGRAWKERLCFYAIVPPILWFFWFYFIIV